MNDENCKIIRKEILAAAEYLKGKLPDHTRHPTGRNPYAHIPKVIKDAAGGVSYKDLPDEAFEYVIDLIHYCRDNPF